MKRKSLKFLLTLGLSALLLSSCLEITLDSSRSSSEHETPPESSSSKTCSSASSSSTSSKGSSSSSSSSKTSGSSSSSFSSSTATDSSSSSSVPAPSVYRVAPKKAGSSDTSVGVYSVSYSGSSFTSTLVKTLTKGSYYTTYQDVAAYWIGFGAMPVNYLNADDDSSRSCKNTKDEGYKTYGESTRLWFTYHRTDGYMTQVPDYNLDNGRPTYYELDIASSWNSYYNNRGALRLMAMPFGLVQYGTDPVIFYTSDHYDTFSEYYNYSGGWGTSFASQSDYSTPTTVTASY